MRDNPWSPPARLRLYRQIRNTLRRGRSAPSPAAAPIEVGKTEATLVALGAMHFLEPRWLEEDTCWKALIDRNVASLGYTTAGDREMIERVIGEHEAEFGWPPEDEHRRMVLEFASGVYRTPAAAAGNGAPGNGGPGGAAAPAPAGAGPNA